MEADPWILSDLTSIVEADDGWLWGRVRAEGKLIQEDLASRGLTVLGPDDHMQHNFRVVARHLASIPTLQAATYAAIEEIVILDAPAGYDISHSEPKWRAKIFVSSPSDGTSASPLRLLENVVHEAMHLQLTNVEKRRPLVLDFAAQVFSPWMAQNRDIQGVLHGFYVFACILALFSRQSFLNKLDQRGTEYATRRCSAIRTELDEVDMHALVDGLTRDGRTFFEWLTMKPKIESAGFASSHFPFLHDV